MVGLATVAVARLVQVADRLHQRRCWWRHQEALEPRRVVSQLRSVPPHAVGEVERGARLLVPGKSCALFLCDSKRGSHKLWKWV